MNLQKVSLFCLLMLLLYGTVADAKIVFSSRRDGMQGVYVMDDDGSNQTLLKKGEEGDRWHPLPDCWSPDGKQIAFSDRFGEYLMDPDGTNIRKLPTLDKAYIGRMSFSPDSKSLVFNMRVEIDGKEKESVNVLNIETGEIKEIADVSAISCDWSPDGKSIVFSKPGVVGEDAGGTLWVMGADGHNPRKLLRPPIEGAFKSPRFSPDGKQIVYFHNEYVWEPRPGVALALIYKAHRYLICDRNGENIKQLRIPKDWHPLQINWMDDGKSVVFSAYVGIPLDEMVLPDQYPPGNIYKYHIPTGEITRLTDHPGKDWALDWISDDVLSVSPKGKMQTQWGKLKKFLESRSETFKSLSQNALFFLRNQR